MSILAAGVQLQPIDCWVYCSATLRTPHPPPPKSKWTSLVQLTIIEGVEALAYGDQTDQRALVTPTPPSQLLTELLCHTDLILAEIGLRSIVQHIVSFPHGLNIHQS